ncbi:glycosyltransferase [Pontibacter virosus]|uniref:Glycosyltransferase involved in cell wall biosynthesis n=1 Tax=Pontibacter virosus TaxID=1765052 RepID=A0A2U1AJS5_9BACT|nr:glycosyltransferase [Pontibacter virosus]PVY36668.1 glycosyltransferase involved in cell wall biosynthesis [Pontibacter virosus]
MTDKSIKIILFIGSLRSGGKERRLVELLSYLQKRNQYKLLVVMTSHKIDYQKFYDLNIPYYVIPKSWSKNDLTIFYKFYKIVKSYEPDLIHTWGKIQTLYSLPSILKTKVPLINSQITAAPPFINKISISFLINLLNFKISKTVIANSYAGLEAFTPPMNKSYIIYNGVDFDRFKGLADKLAIKKKYNIKTPYTVIMVASVSQNKDYKLFFEIAQIVTKLRSDISFIGVGSYIEADTTYQHIKKITSNNDRLIFPGRIDDVEALINACDIGVLFSPNGEGTSNAIIEYMALSKPVIASRVGGNLELISHNENGYLVKDSTAIEIAELVTELIDDKEKRDKFGERSKEFILNSFSLESMGRKFEEVYMNALGMDIPKITNDSSLIHASN